ncbi:hypothetical protein [Streptomyces sp. NBC_00347]|uniref:hypothetical protein n=1 Tax=Streptomyces sp. NBC_00347 TaxID=2975721 RepID=UPI002259A5F8|nr:hypothetical protein [Streptomyces sp. NBC_00347]MCX5127877.1 hypothetical protein [Streptomyces sp. NBC_00347]
MGTKSTTPTTPAAPATPSATAGIAWDEAFCSEGANCFRFGRDAEGKAYIGTTDSAAYVTDSIDALRALISAVKAGAADHLLA